MAARKEKRKDVLEMIESRMTPASVARSDAKAKKLLLGVRLAAFRKSVGLDQGSVKGFKQPAVSKIEGRADIKLSTLVEYCRGLGAELKIVAKKKGGEFVLVE
ncbi:MAG TPA: hypothetical protein VFE58_19990 [Tepidisphaeraceae bacterium]|jgi:hypothetical protein|nr:hypothetical protein [Tepidisphaeraceae bacterium]